MPFIALTLTAGVGEGDRGLDDEVVVVPGVVGPEHAGLLAPAHGPVRFTCPACPPTLTETASARPGWRLFSRLFGLPAAWPSRLSPPGGPQSVSFGPVRHVRTGRGTQWRSGLTVMTVVRRPEYVRIGDL